MAVVTICSDFGAQWKKKKKSVTVSIVSPSIYYEMMGPDAMIFIIWLLTVKPGFSLSSSIFIFSSSLISVIRVVSSAYLRLWIFLPANSVPAFAPSSPAFHLIHSAYKLNKQGNNIQGCTPSPMWNQSGSRNRWFSGILCFIYDPTDVVSLNSGSSAISKSSLNV